MAIGRYKQGVSLDEPSRTATSTTGRYQSLTVDEEEEEKKKVYSLPKFREVAPQKIETEDRGFFGPLKRFGRNVKWTVILGIPSLRERAQKEDPEGFLRAATQLIKSTEWVEGAETVLGPWLRRMWPTKAYIALGEKMTGRKMMKTYDEMVEQNPGITFVSGLTGDIWNLLATRKAIGATGLREAVAGRMPGLDKIASPFIQNFIPRAIENSTIFGTKGLIDEVTDQFQDDEFIPSRVASETGKGMLFGTLLSGPLSTTSPILQVGGTGLVFGGVTALEGYLRDGEIDTNDWLNIGTNLVLGIILGALGVKGRVRANEGRNIARMQNYIGEQKFGVKNWAMIGQLEKARIIAQQYPNITQAEAMRLAKLLPESRVFPSLSAPPAIVQQIKQNAAQELKDLALLPENQQSMLMTQAAGKTTMDVVSGSNIVDAFLINLKDSVNRYFAGAPEATVPNAEAYSRTATPEQQSVILGLLERLGYRGKELIQEKMADVVKDITGKDNPTEMNINQANDVISTLNQFVNTPSVPMPPEMVVSKLAEMMNLKEIGLKERFRGIDKVFEKIGLSEDPMFTPDAMMTKESDAREEWFRFNEAISEQKKTVAKIPDSSKRIFRHLNNTYEEPTPLTPEELRVAKWVKTYLDNWADRLNIPQSKRRKHYITNIFEEHIKQQIRENKQISVSVASALDFSGISKTMFHPFLQQRLGLGVGLIEDVWRAVSAYASKSIQVYHYEPLLEKLAMYQKFAPENTRKFLTDFSKRLTSAPLDVDKEIKQDMKEFAALLKNVKGMEKLATQLEQGNPAGLMAHNMAGLLYEIWLGFRPASAIKNLTQQGLTLAEVGPRAYMQAKAMQYTKEGKDLIRESIVMRGRKAGFFLPGVDETFIKRLHGKRREIAMWLFKRADQDNVGAAFLSGYKEATNLGLPHDVAVQRGDEVARHTQYIYTKMMTPVFNTTIPGRLLSVFTSWPKNWAELMVRWFKGRPSNVYKNYTKMTGKGVGGYAPTGVKDEVTFKKNKSAVWRYLLLVGIALATHKKTKLKALYYTGWTSVRTLTDIGTLDLPGLSIPKDILGIIGSLSMGDTKRAKKHWNNIRPDKQILIIRQLEDIISGRKDWLNLFFYLDNKRDGSKSPGSWPSEATPIDLDLEDIDLKDLKIDLKDIKL